MIASTPIERLALTSLTVRGDSESGGEACIVIQGEGGELVLTDVRITECTTSRDGSAVRFSFGTGTAFTATNCEF